MWNDRYNSETYAYGKDPNEFLAAHFKTIPPGEILSLAEGEGRNAVFLALQGYSVTAVDSSVVGLQKAQRLADENGVSLTLLEQDLSTIELGEDKFTGIVSIFCPLPSNVRRTLHAQVVRALKPGGIFLIEAYTPEQVHRDTGGGKNPDVLQSEQSIREELKDLICEHLVELTRNVVEGDYHTGPGAVVQYIGRKG